MSSQFDSTNDLDQRVLAAAQQLLDANPENTFTMDQLAEESEQLLAEAGIELVYKYDERQEY